MLAALVVALRSLTLICGGHRAVALENLALRQQLAVFKRTAKLPQLRHGDRLFWMLDAALGTGRPGGPSTNAAIRMLVMKIVAANPLWGAPRIHGELGKPRRGTR